MAFDVIVTYYQLNWYSSQLCIHIFFECASLDVLIHALYHSQLVKFSIIDDFVPIHKSFITTEIKIILISETIIEICSWDLALAIS